ncbi:hypothetical protein CHUAL_006354 [Chamberlinius hualienensis]
MAANRFIVFSSFVLLMAVLLIGVWADPEPEAFADPEPAANPDPLILPFPRPCLIRNHFYTPVCGSNGVTYRNINYFRCAALKIPGLGLRHQGVCRF